MMNFMKGARLLRAHGNYCPSSKPKRLSKGSNEDRGVGRKMVKV
jgi:hypothetical protein